jgi:hypothetical protein
MLTSLDAIQTLMKELGPQTGNIDAVVQNGDKTWAIQFDSDAVVFLEWDEQPPRLVLSTELGKIGEAREIEVLRLLLSYNLLWRDTGGVKAALGGPEGAAMLLYECHADSLTLEVLQTVLENFRNSADIWRRYIEQGPAENSPSVFSLQQFGDRA